MSIDGDAGLVIRRRVRLGEPPSASSGNPRACWAGRTRGRRSACSPTPTRRRTRRRRARANGAEGVGLVRTEHMFFGTPARLKAVRRMTLAIDDTMLQSALKEIAVFQELDFSGILKAMDGLPVVVRTLDPPLHEFLPPPSEIPGLAAELVKDLDQAGGKARRADDARRAIAERAASLREVNPMLGKRGCRLGIASPQITKAQCVAFFRAAAKAEADGVVVRPHVMIPLVSFVPEFEHQKAVVLAALDEVKRAFPSATFDVKIGLMVETPRSAPPPRRRDARRFLLLRHKRPDADDARFVAGRRRADVGAVREVRRLDVRPVRADRPRGRRRARRAVRRLRASRRAEHLARRLRRTRRRSKERRVSTPSGATTCRAHPTGSSPPDSQPGAPRSNASARARSEKDKMDFRK